MKDVAISIEMGMHFPYSHDSKRHEKFRLVC